ncbi:MAG: SDR family oxidoreductase [Alphaproteobacteria bacterium]|nr:SDR family oxidoreductase [Alphaproteobacteria bacterium]
MEWKGRTVLVTGGSRGIGRAIALRAARAGANVAIAAKTAEPHPKLSGTIHTVAAEIEAAGGKALPLVVDVRDDAVVEAAVARTAETFGGIDVVVNNASAIQLTGTLDTAMKRFDLMFSVNVRGTYSVSRAAMPHLLRSPSAHVLVLSPPITLDPSWYGNHLAYTMSKMGMSMCVLGLAKEFAGKVAVNALWPRTTIATAAIEMIGGDALARRSRKDTIMADAAFEVLSGPVSATGAFHLDEDVLRAAGVTDFSAYAVDPTQELAPDLFL